MVLQKRIGVRAKPGRPWYDKTMDIKAIGEFLIDLFFGVVAFASLIGTAICLLCG